LGGHIGRLIAAKLEKESIPQNFVWIEDQSCLSISIIDSEGQTHTHITEPSPIVPQKRTGNSKQNWLNYRPCVGG